MIYQIYPSKRTFIANPTQDACQVTSPASSFLHQHGSHNRHDPRHALPCGSPPTVPRWINGWEIHGWIHDRTVAHDASSSSVEHCKNPVWFLVLYDMQHIQIPTVFFHSLEILQYCNYQPRFQGDSQTSFANKTKIAPAPRLHLSLQLHGVQNSPHTHEESSNFYWLIGIQRMNCNNA